MSSELITPEQMAKEISELFEKQTAHLDEEGKREVMQSMVCVLKNMPMTMG